MVVVAIQTYARNFSHLLLAVVYHPPSAPNSPLYEHITEVLDTVSRQHSSLGILVAGDFNQFPDSLLEAYPLQQIVKIKTRGESTLDKIFTNVKQWYNTPSLAPAFGRSDHEAILLAPTDSPPVPRGFHVAVRTRAGGRTAAQCSIRQLKMLIGRRYCS